MVTDSALPPIALRTARIFQFIVSERPHKVRALERRSVLMWSSPANQVISSSLGYNRLQDDRKRVVQHKHNSIRNSRAALNTVYTFRICLYLKRKSAYLIHHTHQNHANELLGVFLFFLGAQRVLLSSSKCMTGMNGSVARVSHSR